MDIASTLLTKKAALIGGGAAATTTAVTVPIVVTQGKEETPGSGSPSATKNRREAPSEGGGSPTADEDRGGTSQASQQQEIADPMKGEIVIPPLDHLAKLDLTGEDFYENFNKPGYCLKKLFPGIERSNFFKAKGEGEIQPAPASISKHNIFSEEDINNGCYSINKETSENGKQRIELIAQSPNEGWLWMSGLKPEDNKLKLWFKEAYLKKENEVWKVIVGQEGEIAQGDGYTPKIPDLESANSKFKTFKKLNPETRQECGDQPSQNCQTHIARVGYWDSAGTPSAEFMKIEHGSSGNHITRWSYHKTFIWKTGNRKRVFLEGKWHENTTAEKEEERKLIHVEDSKVPTKKGVWKDLHLLCNESRNSDPAYPIYCTKPN